MTDMEIIQAIAKALKIKLERRVPGEIGDILWEIGKPGYCLDDTGAVTGLRLNRLAIKPAVEYMARLKRLTHLNLYSCQLASGDLDFLAGLDRLTHLNLSFNPDISDYSFLGALKGLKMLYLRENNLTEISFLRLVPGLTELDLSDNPGIGDYSFLKALKGLKELYLRENNLTAVSFLRLVPGLTKLNLSRNPGIGDYSFLQALKGLTGLYLWSNNLTEVSFLRGLPGLETLHLWNNKITDLSFVTALDHLTDLNIAGNPVENPPPEIVKQGVNAIRDYFRSLKGEELRPLNEVKVLLVGSGGAGKTSLLKRLSDRDFDPHESKTHGIGIQTIPIEIDKTADMGHNSPLIQAHFWDFGGQEVMHASHQFFLSKRSLYILVVDSREEQTPEYWLKHIATFGGSSPVLVVINKIDESPQFDLDRHTLTRKYPNILGFYRLSCRSGDGLPALKAAVRAAIPQTELLQTPVAASWLRVKSTLEAETREKCYISHAAFGQICDRERIPADTSRETLIGFLNELGIVLHFKDFGLEEYHVLNPRWVTEGVYRIINSRALADRHGLLKKADVGRLINEAQPKTCDYSEDLKGRAYTPGEWEYIVKLMQKFELCYELDKDFILVPALLDTKEPMLAEETGTGLDFMLAFDFLPKSVISRLLVKLHPDLVPGLYWRTGMVLKSGLFQTRALIRADEVEKTVTIRITGKQKREHLGVIRSALREINRGFEPMKIDELIPLPLPEEVGQAYREKHKGAGKYARTVSYEFLLGYERSGIPDYFDGETGQTYRVAQLLDTVTLPEERRGQGFTGADSGRPIPPPRPETEAQELNKKLERIKELNRIIDDLGREIDLKKKQKDLLDTQARKHVRRHYLWIPAVMVLLILALYILIKTDIWPWSAVEPDTYVLALLLVPTGLVYLLIKGKPFFSSSAYERAIEKEREKLYSLNLIDADGLDKMKTDLYQAIKERDSL